MDQDQQRDYAEEAANRALLHEEDNTPLSVEEFSSVADEALDSFRKSILNPDPGAEFGLTGHQMDYQAFAEEALKFYRLVANHPLTEICASSTDAYEGAKTALMYAITLAYPDIEEIDIYETAIDSGENIAHCAQYVRDHGKVSLRR